eukprot:scaffold124319_cov85-Cyclotella_meneghiniana.AAC.3
MKEEVREDRRRLRLILRASAERALAFCACGHLDTPGAGTAPTCSKRTHTLGVGDLARMWKVWEPADETDIRLDAQ